MLMENDFSPETEKFDYTLIVLGADVLDNEAGYRYTNSFGKEQNVRTDASFRLVSRVLATAEYATKLREQGLNVNIIFTGGTTNPNKDVSEANSMKTLFQLLTDPDGEGSWNSRLTVEERAWDTRSNAINSLNMITPETAGNIVVITNGVQLEETYPLHVLNIAQKAFENAGWSNGVNWVRNKIDCFNGAEQFLSHAWRAFPVFQSVGKRLGFDTSKISVVPAEVILQSMGVKLDAEADTDASTRFLEKVAALWTTFFDCEGKLLNELTKRRITRQEP